MAPDFSWARRAEQRGPSCYCPGAGSYDWKVRARYCAKQGFPETVVTQLSHN